MQYIYEADIAIAAAKQATILCKHVQHSLEFTSLEKLDQSPVTIADFGAQAIICRLLAEHFPQDAIVAEESSSLLRQSPTQLSAVQKLIPDATPDQILDWIDLGQGKVEERFWTLDPIDGTKGFLRNQQYATAIALIESGEVKVGVLSCPAFEEGCLFVAIQGQGTRRISLQTGESRMLSVLDAPNFRLAESVETSHGDLELQRMVAQSVGLTAPSLQMDSQAKYGAISSGHAVLYMRLPWKEKPNYQENIWDHAAGAIIVEEVGGRVTDMDGKPLNFAVSAQLIENRGIIASVGEIHTAVLASIAQQMP
jgi:3'(2'), 5'-bisphosphate nucleotidase